MTSRERLQSIKVLMNLIQNLIKNGLKNFKLCFVDLRICTINLFYYIYYDKNFNIIEANIIINDIPNIIQ